MINRRDLEIAVRELEHSQPTYQTCSKLADLYIILDHLKPESYSESAPKTDFLKAVAGKDMSKVLSVMNEMMEATQVLNPRLYENVLMRINEL